MDFASLVLALRPDASAVRSGDADVFVFPTCRVVVSNAQRLASPDLEELARRTVGKVPNKGAA